MYKAFCQRNSGTRQILESPRSCLGFGLGAAQCHHQRRQHEHLVGVTACGGGLRVQIGPERDRSLEGWWPREHHLGVSSGQPDAGGRLSCLNEHRVPLRRPGKRQDTFDVVILTVEAWRVQLGAICPHATLTVTDDRVVVPAVPRTRDSFDELVCARIPIGALRMEPFTEIRRRQWRDGGDDVPAGATATEMIQRRKPAGEIPRLAVGR